MKDVFKLVLAQIRSKHETAGDFRAQVAANTTGVRRVLALVDAARPRHDPRDDGASCSTTPSGARAPSSPRSRTASTRPRARRQRRLHGRARPAAGARRDRRRRRALRHDRLRPAAARAGQLDLRDDVLGLRVRAQVPDRPRPAGQRRLLPARHRRRARGHASRTARWPGRGRRRLGDARAPGRGDLPGAAARRSPSGCPRGRRG